ncbi:MAG: PAS domain-containing sensor histidine kinase [Marinifilaceae bacterium]|nr:PAS domain-containing sensor histidine kinase [Marinifilaceae bacterium]
MSKLIKIVNRVSSQLIKVDEEFQIYQIMYDGIREVIPDVYFLITKLQPDDMNFRIIHSFGFDKFINSIKTLLGKNPFEIDFPFSDMDDAKQKAYESGKLFHFDDGLFDLVNGKINKTICKTIERTLGISQIYAISFSAEKYHFGGASFFIPKDTIEAGLIDEDTKLAIETIAFQASLAINSIRHIYAVKEKRNDLIITQSRFNQLVNLMNDIVWKANGDGTEIIDLSNSFEKYYGFPASDFSKNPNLWFEVIHPEDREIAQESSNRLFRKGNAECEYRIIKPDGKIIWLYDRKSIIFDSLGNPIQMGGVATDVTERKLLEEQLLLKNYALDNSPNAVGFANLNGIITYVNDSYANLFGYSDKTEIIGKHISEFASNDDHPEKVINTLKRGEIYFGNGTPKRKDGSTFYSIISASPVIHRGKMMCIMAVFIDITDLKVAETKLRENEERLSKLNKEKDRFFSIIAHDLKSPFNGMLGLLEIMANNYFYYSDEDRLKIIQSSYFSAQKAFNLLSDLLEWAKLQNGHFEINKEALNLIEIINENIDLYKKNASEKEIIIMSNINTSIYISIDRNSINSVVRNILNNAIKFTKNGGLVEFDVKQSNNNIELSIKDNGVGMSEETISKLFRIDESITMPGTNNEKGTGLGLTICNDIVIKNNWKMNIESQLGKGTSIKILIPNCIIVNI